MAQGFDFRSMLDSMLAGGRELATKGEDAAARGLGVGNDAASRESMRRGMLGGAMGAGVMALLLGSRTARRVGTTGLALGGIAALGKMAYDKWQEHEAGKGAAPRVDQLEGPAADARARLLITAMIGAAKADGHVDATERQAIQSQLAVLGEEGQALLFEELGRPADPEAVARGADDPQSRAEVYTVSAMVCGDPNPEERAYLDRLAAALGMPAAEARAIEADLRTAG